MDISTWSPQRKLCLPDWCFGNRFTVWFGGRWSDFNTGIDISPMALPEFCVLWELWAFGFECNAADTGRTVGFSLYLGDQLPGSAGAMATMEPLFPNQPYIYTGLHSFWGNVHLTNLRTLIHAKGRRVIFDRFVQIGHTFDFNCVLVFSGLPTEVPDCLISP